VSDDTARPKEIPTPDLRTAHEWNADRANTWRIHSWSDFNRRGETVIGPNDRITRGEFDRRKWWCSGVGRLSLDELAQLRGQNGADRP